jgi:AraC-like DNA-binding protein
MEMSSFPFDGTSSGTSSSPFEGKPSGRSTPQTSQTTRGRPRRLRSKLPDNSPYRGAEIVAAVAAGDITQAGRLIRSALANAPVDSRRNGRVRAARAIALASAVLEAAESAGLDIEDVWKQFPEFVALVYTRSNENELVAATRALFRRAARRSDDPDLAAIDRYVLDALPRQSAIRLDELAAALGKHPTAITHRLQRKFGLSFKQYVSRLRIDRAKDLLCRTRLSVTDVAMRVGVDDPANFAKLFRKFEGLSPLQYRERYGVRP